MDDPVYFTYLLTLLLAGISTVQGQEYCEGKTFWCDKGHCCGKGKCCAYYYELWWFWLIWALIILLSCCCLYQQKRFRHRRQQSRRRSGGRTQNRSRIVQALDAAFMTQLFDPDRVRLPTYDEAKDMPKDPPPYNMLYATTLPVTAVNGQQSSHDATEVPVQRQINEAPQASLIDNEEQVAVATRSWRDPPPPYTPTSPPYTPISPPYPVSTPCPVYTQSDQSDTHVSTTQTTHPSPSPLHPPVSLALPPFSTESQSHRATSTDTAAQRAPATENHRTPDDSHRTPGDGVVQTESSENSPVRTPVGQGHGYMTTRESPAQRKPSEQCSDNTTPANTLWHSFSSTEQHLGSSSPQRCPPSTFTSSPVTRSPVCSPVSQPDSLAGSSSASEQTLSNQQPFSQLSSTCVESTASRDVSTTASNM